MVRAKLVGADASADMRNQSMGLARGVLKSTNLKGADLRGANLSRTNPEFANLTNADLTGADLDTALLPDDAALA
jgi:uncharacterized protein YjbI with pentapeptide repeats